MSTADKVDEHMSNLQIPADLQTLLATMMDVKERREDGVLLGNQAWEFFVPFPKKHPTRKTAYVIGTGPSLKKIDVSKLKDEHTITFNRAYIAFEEWGFDPTYYLSIDPVDIHSIHKDINNLIENSEIKKFFLSEVVKSNPIYKDEFDIDLKEKENVHFLISPPHGMCCFLPFSHFVDAKRKNLIFTPLAPNAGWCGLKMLYQLGYEEVALLGCDARYKTDEESQKDVMWFDDGCVSTADTDANHFREDYFGKDQKFGLPNEAQQIAHWREAALEIGHFGLPIKVYSCSEGSNLNNYFPYIDFEDFLNGKR